LRDRRRCHPWLRLSRRPLVGCSAHERAQRLATLACRSLPPLARCRSGADADLPVTLSHAFSVSRRSDAQDPVAPLDSGCEAVEDTARVRPGGESRWMTSPSSDESSALSNSAATSMETDARTVAEIMADEDIVAESTSGFRLSGRSPSSSTRRRPAQRYADSGSIADRPKRAARPSVPASPFAVAFPPSARASPCPRRRRRLGSRRREGDGAPTPLIITTCRHRVGRLEAGSRLPGVVDRLVVGWLPFVALLFSKARPPRAHVCTRQKPRRASQNSIPCDLLRQQADRGLGCEVAAVERCAEALGARILPA